jgi:hypothetical protein
MTVDQVAERVALDCRIAIEAPDVAATLSWRVEAALGRMQRGVPAASGKTARWTVGPQSGLSMQLALVVTFRRQ